MPRVHTNNVTGDRETRNRLGLAIEALRSGNVFVVWALDRLAHNLAPLIKL